MKTGEDIKKIRNKVLENIEKIFEDLEEEKQFYLAAYLVSATCCFNRYRCYVEMDTKSKEEIGRKRETKYVAVLCEKKLYQMGYTPDFEKCRNLSAVIFRDFAEEIVDIFMTQFGNEFKENYIFELAKYISLVNSGGEEANYEAAWSLVSVLNNIEKNNEVWEFWHIHGILKEKVNYFNRAPVFQDEKISVLAENKEFWDLICNAMEAYRQGTDMLIWITNNDKS